LASQAVATASFTWLFVHPSFRRKGVATVLVTEMLGRLARPVTLSVAAGNFAARSLYERIGFTIKREFTGYFHGIACKVAKLRYWGLTLLK
jgi:ribosomal protein S18 acetylase RimI-like enzyme